MNQRTIFAGLFVIGLVARFHPAAGAPLSPPPQLGVAGREDFSAYVEGPPHKAFAIAPGGAWAWVSGAASGELALRQAMERCAELTEQPCVPYAVDVTRVWDEKRWANLLRLGGTEGAPSGGIGLRRGAQFPDVLFKDPSGRSVSASQLRGKPVVLHFWGSWCGPCRRELPDMAALAKALGPKGIAFVPLQVREAHAVSKHWIVQQGIDLALYDSGVRSEADGGFAIRGGGQLPDRAVAPVFPSTVVLDRQGRVVLKHHGPIERWEDYRAMLLALAR